MVYLVQQYSLWFCCTKGKDTCNVSPSRMDSSFLYRFFRDHWAVAVLLQSPGYLSRLNAEQYLAYFDKKLSWSQTLALGFSEIFWKEGTTDLDLSFLEQVQGLKPEQWLFRNWDRLGFCCGCCTPESWGLCAVQDNEQLGLERKKIKTGLKIQRRPDRSKEGYG